MQDLKSTIPKMGCKVMNQKIETLLKKAKMDAANEIADKFTLGFFDEHMVSDVANIIGKHFEKFSEEIVTDCSELISIPESKHCFANNEYGVGYTDGRNDAAYMIQSFHNNTENDQNKS